VFPPACLAVLPKKTKEVEENRKSRKKKLKKAVKSNKAELGFYLSILFSFVFWKVNLLLQASSKSDFKII